MGKPDDNVTAAVKTAMPARWFTSDDPVRAATDVLGHALGQALQAAGGGRVTFVVSGGRTPAAVMPGLLRIGLDWDRIDVFAGDERIVPVDHADSTEGLFRLIFAEAGTRLCYHGPNLAMDRTAMLDDWRRRWQALQGHVAAAFLGVGPDGHTASLFPQRPESADAGLIAALVPETPPHKHDRLTLGAAALARAQRIVLVAQGGDKRKVLSEALGDRATSLALPVTWLTRLDQTEIHADGPIVAVSGCTEG